MSGRPEEYGSRATPKKPSGARPLARRLLSKDSATSHFTRESSGESRHRLESSDEGIQPNRNEGSSRIASGKTEEFRKPWIDVDLTRSPSPSTESPDATSSASEDKRSAKFFYQSARPSSPFKGTNYSRSTLSLEPPPPVQSDAPPPSPSKARWDMLRERVLNPPLQPVPSPPAMSSPSSSFTSFSQLNLPRAAPAASKQSRLARLGFRQVVDNAREAEGSSRKFAEEIRKACWVVRFSDVRPKHEREPAHGTAGSNILPFLAAGSSTTSLSSQSPSSSNLNLPSGKSAIRRPQSVHSLALTTKPHALAALHSLITRHASNHRMLGLTNASLPHEGDVLSVILSAFLTNSADPSLEEGRRLALDIFETIIRTWNAPSSEEALERCLWCCKAASVQISSIRSQLISILGTLLRSSKTMLTTPVAFRTMLPALFMLLYRCSETPTIDTHAIKDIIMQVLDGECGHLDLEDLQQKYNAVSQRGDSEDDLRRTICADAIVRCQEFGSPPFRRWTLRNVEEYWSHDIRGSFTPLRTKVYAGKIKVFLRSSTMLLQESAKQPSGSVEDEAAVFRILQTRIVPELNSMRHEDVIECKCLAVKNLVWLTCFEFPERAEVVDLLAEWIRARGSWQTSVEQEVKQFIESGDWGDIVRICGNLISVLPEDSHKWIAGITIPQIHERLTTDPPTCPFQPLTNLLLKQSQLYPQLFFKPLFACAASVKDVLVMHQLAILVALTRFMPDFWTRDAEMMSVALMSDPGAGIGKGKGKEGEAPIMGKARLGQSILLLELTCRLRDLRLAKKGTVSLPEQTHSALIKFVTSLESRLAILLDAKEQKSLLPLSQRLLFAVLFLEIRLTTRSLKIAPWLNRILSWMLSMHAERGSDSQSPFNSELVEEYGHMLDKYRALYTACREDCLTANKRRTTVVFSPKPDGKFNGATFGDSKDSLATAFANREVFLASFPMEPMSLMLELVVTICGMLKPDSYVRLGPLLWDGCLDSGNAKIVAPACFLVMQYAEKAPTEFMSILNRQLSRPSASVRRQAVLRLSTLSSWRFQLLSQSFITDRSYRRPFKLARPPISFVPTDVGSSFYVPQDDRSDKDFHGLPQDLRRKLSEMGWSDESKPADQELEWARTPISLLPSGRLDRLAYGDMSRSPAGDVSSGASPASSPSRSPSPSATPNLTRSASSGGLYHGVKRRPVFVQPLAVVFLSLTSLAMDEDFTVANLARDVIVDFMRDDPSTLGRPIVDILSGNPEELEKAMSAIRIFLHSRHILPPGLAHLVFNHLAGFLKHHARVSESSQTLHDYAYTVPILAKLVNQVSEMSVRDLRRAKIETFFFPSGSLWFSDPAPSGHMFPRGPEAVTNPFESLSNRLVSVTMIRTSQNMFFVAMLKRNPDDVHVIRKSLSRLILPTGSDESGERSLDVTDLLPCTPGLRPSRVKWDPTLDRLSMTLARSHLLLVAQIFRSMTRHLNDRNELANLLDGVNRILLAHGDDTGIVGHALIVYMIASTRFRRLMTSGTCFTIFMPVLVKIYCESEGNTTVRAAIEYAVSRFYAVHEETFAFQALDVLAILLKQQNIDAEWVAKNIYCLMSTLRESQTSAPDAAGIHGVNKAQEQETMLAITAEQRPQAFLASLRKDGRSPPDKAQAPLPETFDDRKFKMDDLVRMMLTVIAHDPNIQRAENFLRLFRHLVPHLYNASSSARIVLRDGIDALGLIILNKISGKAKVPDFAQIRPEKEKAGVEVFSADSNFGTHSFGKPNSPSDVNAMRQDYLLSLVVFASAGGQSAPPVVQRGFEIAKAFLKDASRSTADTVRVFIDAMAETTIKRGDLKYTRSIMKDIIPVIASHGMTVDLSGLYNTVEELCRNSNSASDRQFFKPVIVNLCEAGLDVCEVGAVTNMLFSLPSRTSFISLLSRTVCLYGPDGLPGIVNRRPTPGFLAGVVLPFALALPTSSKLPEVVQWTDASHRDAHGRVWVRLLGYIVSVVQGRKDIKRSNSASTQDRSKNEEKRRSTQLDDSVSSLVLSLQIIKIIIIRAEDDLSALVPGIWCTMATILRSSLDDGDATFALTHESNFASSPTTSSFGGTSPVSFKPGHRPSSSISSDVSITSDQSSQKAPRVIDYLLWSMMEFMCLRRSPLVPQLRMFLREKVYTLDQELHTRLPGRPSMFQNRRLSGSPFAKPRGRNSAASSPGGSPRLHPSDSLNISHLTLDTTYQGYNRFPSPISPLEDDQRPATNRKIVHLGPNYRPPTGRLLSQAQGIDMNSAVKSTNIRSPALINRTYERIRTVQSFMGYSVLLPMQEEGEIDCKSWTKGQALERILSETKQLTDEFLRTDVDFEFVEASP
ncbi:hypothetical protein BD410DRAFT_784972 [Rickenella mellea]|uniref:Protein UNC80 C-terminal domain-containing protein n=1 Tax=Rickenella mellea TaxID=50990 RepID=A0A4Y7QBT6_9AGAM|nr:hypothetical protein BD410DRAFT_784972 [Rickenella mellea]